MKDGISIIICCYNSSTNLSKTLEAIALQKTDRNLQWEVIVVDNNSTDNTKQVAVDEWHKYDIKAPLYVFEEKMLGLSFARAKGFAVAKYEFCLFCDDDNWLESNYLMTAYRLLKDGDQIGVLGGIGEEVCEEVPPVWFSDLKGGYAVGKQAETSGDVSSRGYVYGAGAVFRKSVYTTLVQKGFRSLLTDRKGKSLSSGGDKELCYAYRLQGFRIYYSEELKFKHFIPKYKLSKDYATRMFLGFSAAQPILNLYEYVIRGTHLNKSNRRLGLMWITDFFYTFYLVTRFAGKGVLNFRMQMVVVKHLFRLANIYKSLYLQITSLKA